MGPLSLHKGRGTRVSNLSAARTWSAAVQLMIASALLASPVAAVGIGPSIEIWADGQQVASLSCETGGGLQCDDKGIATLAADLTIESSEYIITLIASGINGIKLDPDPQISYASAIVDVGAASTFNFVFSQGIVPTATPGFASHTHSSNTTDGANNGVPVTATAPPVIIPLDGDIFSEIAKYTLSTNGGTTFLSAGMDLSPSFVGAAGTSDIQGPFFESGPGPAGTGFYDVMRVDVNFSMGGGSDRYAFNGSASIVPEPGTGALLGLGLLGVAIRSRRDARTTRGASQGAPAAEA